MSDFQATSRAVDLVHLARYTGGDESLNAEILHLFETQADELVAQLEAILVARDIASWKSVTHTLKGAARGIGAFAFAEAAANAEPLDIDDAMKAASAIAALRCEKEAVSRFLAVYIHGG